VGLMNITKLFIAVMLFTLIPFVFMAGACLGCDNDRYGATVALLWCVVIGRVGVMFIHSYQVNS